MEDIALKLVVMKVLIKFVTGDTCPVRSLLK
jgi:hypothetical protein